jgi:hypothetical protein
MGQDGTDNQMFCGREAHPILQLHGEAIVGEAGVEGLVVQVKMPLGKTGRSGINMRERDHKNHDMFQTPLSWG